MPIKIPSGIPNSSSSLQYYDTQNNQPATMPPMEQSGSSQAAGQISLQARQANEKSKAGKIRRQFYEDKKAGDKIEANRWEDELITDVIVPMNLLLEDFCRIKKPLRDEFEDILKEFESHEDMEPEDQESGPQPHLEQIDKLIAEFGEVITDFNKKLVEPSKKALPHLESFDKLSDIDKDDFYRANDNLKKTVYMAKKIFLECEEERISALLWKAGMLNFRIHGKYERVHSKNEALMEKAPFTDHSGTIHKEVEEVIAKYDKVYQESMAVSLKRIEVIKDCDKVCTHSFLMGDRQGKQNIEKYATNARVKNVSSCSFAMVSAKNKSHLLIELVMLDNKEQQENESLRKWRALAESFITQEYVAATSVSCRLTQEELTGTRNISQLSREEVQIRLEAARDGMSQFEKAIRTCEKTIEAYEKLEGIAKDDRVPLSLQELKTAMVTFAQAREFAVPFWAEQLQALEDRNKSFLPAHLQSKSLQKKADKKLASQQSNVQPESSRKPDFHETTEGIVFGHINEKGELNSLDENEKVIATYFKDQDSGKWVKDYGDEADVFQPVSMVAPVASGKTTAVGEKAGRIALKAGNIAKASQCFSESRLVDMAASNDYDDKFNSLNRAYSEKLQAIGALKNLLVDLEFELKEPQAQDLPGEKLIAELNAHLECLQTEKQKLSKQVAQAKKELDRHTFKRRDPTGLTFEALLKQDQVDSVTKDVNVNRRPSHNNANDWLDRYEISFVKGAQGEKYERWVVHAHYNSVASDAKPVRVHMKRYAERDWGPEKQPYHSPPLRQETFDKLKNFDQLKKKEQQLQQEARKQQAPSAKKGNKKRR